MNETIVDQLTGRNWKRLGGRQLEPVGIKVLVMTSEGEILKAVRSEYAESYNNPVYTSVNYGFEIENAEYWDYL